MKKTVKQPLNKNPIKKANKKLAKKIKIGTKLFKFKANGQTYILTEKEKAFCEYYCQFGAIGADAVIKAGYKCKNRRSAYQLASEYLTKPNIFEYVHSLYDIYGLNDDDVEKEHLFLIKQNGDLHAKARGVDMYFRRTGKYAPEKKEHTIVREYEAMSDDELGEILDEE